MAVGEIVDFGRGARARERWRRRAGAAGLGVLTFLVVLGGGLLATGAVSPALVAEVLRDPAMELKHPFANCAAAQAAGYSSIPRGSRAYKPEQDADDDGFACEPYPGGRFHGSLGRRLARLRLMAR